MATANGSSHSVDCGFTVMYSGNVKVASTKAVFANILGPDCPCAAQMSKIHSVDNTQKVKQPRGARVYLANFVWPGVDGITTTCGKIGQQCHHGGGHNLGGVDVPRRWPDRVDYPNRPDTKACAESRDNGREYNYCPFFFFKRKMSRTGY